MKIKFYKKDIFIVLLLVIFGVLSRTIFHINNNVEFVTAFALSSAFFLQRKALSGVVVLGIMFISDLIIGNSSIFIFTWSGFLFTAIFGFILKNSNFKNLFLTSQAGAIIGTFIFFFWTNFGVVVLSSMYTKDFAGLIQSYQNGLPFLVNQLVGNMIIVPLVFYIFEIFYNNKFNLGLKLKD